MKNLKIFFILLFCLNGVCFAQTRRTILGISLGETKESVNKKLLNENYVLNGEDKSDEIFPISIELYSKPNLKYQNISVEHISLSYCYDTLFCISIITKPVDVANIDLLTNARKVIKQQYNFDKKGRIEIDPEFYDVYSAPAFYSSKDDSDFIMIIYGKENSYGEIPQCYNFMYKSKADEAIQLKKSYQSFSSINGYTELSLEELQKLNLARLQKEEEERKQREAARLEQEKQKQIEEQKRKDEYAKKHRFDKYMGGLSGIYFGGGFYNGVINGGFGTLDFSLKLAGPLSIGVDWKIASLKSSVPDNYGSLKMDFDGYLSLGFKIPLSYDFEPIIIAAVAPGFFIYQERDYAYRYSEKYEAKEEGFIDLRAGIMIPLFDEMWDLKIIYARQITRNFEQLNTFTFLTGFHFNSW